MRPPPSSTLFPYTTLFRSFQIASGHYKQGFPILHHDTLYIMDLLLPKNNALYRSEEHTSELQSRGHLVCRLLLEKTNTAQHRQPSRLKFGARRQLADV